MRSKVQARLDSVEKGYNSLLDLFRKIDWKEVSGVASRGANGDTKWQFERLLPDFDEDEPHSAERQRQPIGVTISDS